MAFAADQCGAAKTQKGFILAAAAGVIVMSGYLIANGGQPPERPSGPTPQELVLAELTAGQIRSFDRRTTERRLALFSDPAEFTDAQLRNAHRAWSRRMEDRAYPDRTLAADMTTITEAAMELRGLRPREDD
jgi:hypothetical protein